MSQPFLQAFLGLKELPTLALWKAVAAEFVGTLLLVLVACGSTLGGDVVAIALCFGFSIATVVQCICHVSGGHVNPAVTLGFLVTCKVSLLRTLLFIVAQILGAIVGAGLMYAVLDPDEHKNVGVTFVHEDLNAGQGFGIELFITFALVLTVNAVCDANRKDIKGSAPLAIGIVIGASHLFAVPLTGAGMNPARSLGPAIVYNSWKDHWIYWLGPIFGGIAAAFLYHFVFSAPQLPTILADDRPLVTIRRSPAKEPVDPNTANV